MKDYGIFDIIGPVMIGPSSSHTAGAARLGKLARDILGHDFRIVRFYLHGSFGKTYKGHGTDKALVAGVLGMDPHDEGLKDSFNIASQNDIGYEFIEADLGYQHPNTVKIVFISKDNKESYILGSSIGGGNILISEINGNQVEFGGNYPTLLIKYNDKKGIISKISAVLSKNDINIASMKVVRENSIATMVIEADSHINDIVTEEIKDLEDIIYIKGINPILR